MHCHPRSIKTYNLLRRPTLVKLRGVLTHGLLCTSCCHAINQFLCDVFNFHKLCNGPNLGPRVCEEVLEHEAEYGRVIPALIVLVKVIPKTSAKHLAISNILTSQEFPKSAFTDLWNTLFPQEVVVRNHNTARVSHCHNVFSSWLHRSQPVMRLVLPRHKRIIVRYVRIKSKIPRQLDPRTWLVDINKIECTWGRTALRPQEMADPLEHGRA
mmetsp:Transcript_12545/g.24315  ORF Transcript_12545/g.24315 Transcript_12545/m.24315 type:complete len:212 (-) Transcript_12545:631-1266(-)